MRLREEIFQASVWTMIMVIIGVVIFLMSKAAFGQCTPANVTTITANGGPLETDQIDANWVELVNACTAIGGPSVHSADQDVTINSDSNTIGAFTVLGNGISLFESDPSTNVVLFEEGTVNFKDSTMVFNSDNDGVGDLTILSDTVALAFYDVSNDEVLYAGTHDFSSSALIDLATTVVNPSSVPFHDFTVNGDTVAQLIFADSSADQVDYHGVQDFSGASTLLTGGTIQSVPSATTFQRSTAGKTGLAVISNGAFNADLDLVRGDDANASIRVTQLGNNTQFIPGSSNTLFLWNPTKLDTNFEIRGDNNDDVFFVDAGTDTVQLSTTVVNPSSDAFSDFTVNGDTETLIFCDASTDTCSYKGSGFNFNHASGSFYFNDNTVATTINTINVWEVLDQVTCDYEDNLTCSTATDDLTVDAGFGGEYEITYHVTGETATGTNQDFEFAVAIDGVIQNPSKSRREFDVGAPGSTSGGGFFDVIAGSSITLEVRNISSTANFEAQLGTLYANLID